MDNGKLRLLRILFLRRGFVWERFGEEASPSFATGSIPLPSPSLPGSRLRGPRKQENYPRVYVNRHEWARWNCRHYFNHQIMVGVCSYTTCHLAASRGGVDVAYVQSRIIQLAGTLSMFSILPRSEMSFPNLLAPILMPIHFGSLARTIFAGGQCRRHSSPYLVQESHEETP